MSDLAVRRDGTELGVIDFVVSENDLAVDDGLDVAVMLSLFCDRRAADDDILPDRETDRRGWWGDEFGPDGDEIGSKLWLLPREKATPDVLQKIGDFAEEALEWMVEDGVAASVTARASIDSGRLVLSVEIERPGEERVLRYGYHLNWKEKAEANGLAT